MEIDLEVIPDKEEIIQKFIELSLMWVEEIDNNDVATEIKILKSKMNFIDFCFIRIKHEIVGVVRMTYSSFFSLGVKPDLDEATIQSIIKVILEDIFFLKPFEVRATLSIKFQKYVQKLGFEYRFGREKMILEMNNAQNLINFEEEDIQIINWRNIEEITEMFVDAYRGTIDESIGMFGEEIAETAMRQVKNGEYGEVIKQLSLFTQENGVLTSGVITSKNESQLFIVIIGTRRSAQGKGLGRKLLTYVIKEGKKMGYEKLSLWVTRENVVAKKLYLSLNFKTISSVISGIFTKPKNKL